MWVALGKCLYTCEWIDRSCRLDSFHSLRKTEILLFLYLGIKGNAQFSLFFFLLSLKIRHFMSVHYISPNNWQLLSTDIFHWLELITVFLSFPKMLSLKKHAPDFFSVSLKIKVQSSFFASIVRSLKDAMKAYFCYHHTLFQATTLSRLFDLF